MGLLYEGIWDIFPFNAGVHCANFYYFLSLTLLVSYIKQFQFMKIVETAIGNKLKM